MDGFYFELHENTTLWENDRELLSAKVLIFGSLLLVYSSSVIHHKYELVVESESVEFVYHLWKSLAGSDYQ